MQHVFPLLKIKEIMEKELKSGGLSEMVRMSDSRNKLTKVFFLKKIEKEAGVVIAKAAELFLLEVTIKSFLHASNGAESSSILIDVNFGFLKKQIDFDLLMKEKKYCFSFTKHGRV